MIRCWMIMDFIFDQTTPLIQMYLHVQYLLHLIPACLWEVTKCPPQQWKKGQGRARGRELEGEKKCNYFFQPSQLIENNDFSVPFLLFTFTWKRHKQRPCGIEESLREFKQRLLAVIYWQTSKCWVLAS